MDIQSQTYRNSMKGRALVTGCTGFLGSHLVKRLLQDGYQVVGMCRDPVVARQMFEANNKSDALVLKTGDLLDVKSLCQCVEGVDMIFHLAAEMDFFPKNKQKVYETNVQGTKNLLQAIDEILCQKNSPNSKSIRVVYASTTETIGGVKSSYPANEESPCNPDYDYGHSKVATEKAIKEFSQKNPQFSYVILRPTGIFGPGDTFVIPELISMVNQGWLFFTPGGGNGQLMFTYIDDVVDAFVAAMTTQNYNHTYIISVDQPLTTKQWITEIAKHLNRQPPFLQLPLFVVKPLISLLSPLMNISKKRTFMFQPVFVDDNFAREVTEISVIATVDRMIEHRNYSNSKAKQQLKWSPKYTIKEGIEATVNHMLHQKEIYHTKYSPISMIGFIICYLFVFILRTLL